MADELNVPTHRWYEPRNNIALPPNAVSPKYILANGVAMIDAWINSQPWGMPLYLFAADEPGWMYDNSDMSTLFQDSAGTTPVTDVGQPVGLQLDKSKGLVLGPELVTNGDFSAGSTGWTVPAGWSITGGVAVATAASGSLRGGGVMPVLGRGYRVEFDVVSYTSGNLYITVGGNFTDQVALTGSGMSPGRKSIFVISGSDAARGVEFYGGAVSATIDNISVKELAGTHRTQSTAASRPTFARLPVTGRRNLLTYTEQFDNAAWTVNAASLTVTPDAALAPDGTVTADKLIVVNGTAVNSTTTLLYQVVSKPATSNTYTATIYAKAAEYNSVRILVNDNAVSTNNAVANWSLVDGTVIAPATFQGTFTSASADAAVNVGNGWYRCSLTFTTATETSLRVRIYPRDTTAVTGDGVRGVLIWGAQLEQAAAATNYQKVVSLYDITEAGVQTAYGLYYDGVDDFLVTPTITPGTDKVQVFAGVRKLSDAAIGIVLEASTSIGGNNGSIQLAQFSGANYTFQSRGTTQQAASYTNAAVAAPVTSVLTGIGDISADISRLLVNGVQVAENLADQGTGNYLAYPVYFGRRGGTTLPFNGYTFREVGRFGPNLDTATIANVENWINQNTGAY